MFEEMKMSPDFFHKSSTTLNILFYSFFLYKYYSGIFPPKAKISQIFLLYHLEASGKQ